MVNKCLKEWNAITEALGNGIQTILLRKYPTSIPEFLLYPSTRYTQNNRYLDQFNPKYQQFVEENSFPKKENDKTEIKYFATVENLMQIPTTRVGTLKNQYIWTSDHVKSYLGGSNAYIWVLRVYKLKKPYMAEPTKAMTFVNLKEGISLEGIKPVLNDKEYAKIVETISTKGKFLLDNERY